MRATLGSRRQCSRAVTGAGVAFLAGCAGPHAGWSEAKLQGWAERNFVLGTPKSEVSVELVRRELRPYRQRYEGRDAIRIDLDAPWYRQPLFGLALAARVGGIFFYFDDQERLEEIKAWVGAVGP
jgi:hypothetical protein